MFGSIRFLAALTGAKAGSALLKALGRQASYFPGAFAIKLCPDFLDRIEKPETVICVTGTNGKTTVCNMIIDALEKCGYDVLDNRAGANVNAGLATSLAQQSTLTGRAKHKVALFEVDERSSHLIYPYIKPTYVVVTNLFRDSIHRNANPEFIFNLINANLPASTHLILNADDNISSQLGAANQKTYFSIDRLPTDRDESVNLINDVRICPRCHKKLHYDYVRYHHIGHAHCEHCGFTSPEGDFRAHIDFAAGTMQVATPEGTESYGLVSDSVFNAYNQVAAISFLRTFGLAHEQVAGAFKELKIVESRYSERHVDSVDVITNMAKGQNPIACSCVFDYVRSEPGRKEVILMLDDVFDRQGSSENMTWIYDCDYEFLNDESIERIVVAGVRRADYRLRLLMAGVPEEKIVVTPKEDEAPGLLKLDGTDRVYVLHELYLAQEALEVRDAICRRIEEKGERA